MKFNYWGKAFDDGSWHHLGHHNLDVAAVIDCLLESNPIWDERIAALSPVPPGHTRSLILFLAACHDLGKFHPGFQRLIPALGDSLGHTRGTYEHHHTEYGLAMWERMRPEHFLDLPDEYALAPLVVAALAHHGRPVDGRVHLGSFYNKVAPDAETFVGEMGAFFLKESFEEYREEKFEPLSWLVAGLIILGDWIGSNEQWFMPDPEWRGAESYWPIARKRARRAIDDLGLCQVAPSVSGGFDDILPHLKGGTPSLMQQAVLDLPAPSGPELLIVEDLTGGGKTEAALLGAHRLMSAGLAAGLYVGLPTMATANAMYGRLGIAYKALFRESDVSLALAHGSTFLNDAYMSSLGRDADTDGGHVMCSRWLADNRKKALLAQCGVGTVDQALLGILGAKHQSLRLLGLSRLALIVDEVHAYDTYTGRLLVNLLRFQAAMGGSAILLSATMTQELRSRLIEAWAEGRTLAGQPVAAPEPDSDAMAVPFPLLTHVTDENCEALSVGTHRALDVAVRPVHAVSGMLDALCQARDNGACVCWIRNTVFDVLEAKRLLVEERGVPSDAVMVFHARFTGGDRADIEEDVLARFGKNSRPEARKGRILIASQVVEQSLDLDFDLLLSDLAPMELMIQRAGRCHRHSRPRPSGYENALMLVMMPEPSDNVGAHWYADVFEKGQYVYPRPAVLWRTARLLCDKGAIVLPRDARELVEGAYADTLVSAPDSLDDAEDKAIAQASADAAIADFGMLKFPSGYALDNTPWGDEVKAPTRLGEPSHGVRLLRVDDSGVHLWHDDGRGPTMDNCVRSEVRVPMRALASAVIPETCASAVDGLMEAMPDKGQWGVCLPLQEVTPGLWAGQAKNGRGQSVAVRYEKATGLIVD